MFLMEILEDPFPGATRNSFENRDDYERLSNAMVITSFLWK